MNTSGVTKNVVSIIIPIYNVRPFLREALDSVIYQSYRNIEILLIDDGSNDGSERICDEYKKKDERVRLIRQKNKGLSAARNAGLNAATGQVIAFLDPDDAYHPDFIVKMLETMEHETVDMVVCNFSIYKDSFDFVRRKEKALPIKEGIYDRDNILRALADDMINHAVWNKLYRRELWEKIRFPVGHDYEDLDTTFKVLSLCNSVCVIDKSLYFHRIRPGSITNTFSQKTITDRIRACSHFESFVRSHTPAVFSEEQLSKVQCSDLGAMVTLYCRYVAEKNHPCDAFERRLRKKIIVTGANIDIEKCNFKIRTAYLLICHCPYLLKIIYPAYHTIKQAVRTMTGR